MRILAVQHNTDGRPCGWGLVRVTANRPAKEALHLAKEIAADQYERHGHPEGEGCYPGERKGTLTVTELPEPEDDVPTTEPSERSRR